MSTAEHQQLLHWRTSGDGRQATGYLGALAVVSAHHDPGAVHLGPGVLLSTNLPLPISTDRFADMQAAQRTAEQYVSTFLHLAGLPQTTPTTIPTGATP